MICLLTIHGIGFQQPPDGDTPGYADQLHERLRQRFGPALGDDPDRGRGPVYVESSWPRASRLREPGLSRIGRWQPDPIWSLDAGPPLAQAGAQLAHVALVYSHVSGEGPAPLAMPPVAALTHYATMRGLARMAVRDVASVLAEHEHVDADPASTGLVVRSDAGHHHHSMAHQLLRHGEYVEVEAPAAGLLAVIRQVEEDITDYLARNELRERVRGFVREAVMRLLGREDITRVVLNGHSKGTVVVFDVGAQLPQPAARRIGGLITAGSPLRKFVDLFAWGTNAGSLAAIQGPWLNFWDEHDPVADPLAPPAAWRRGQPATAASGTSLFESDDPETGLARPVPVADVRVDNLRNSSGASLRAHNYWENPEFLEPVAELLRAAIVTEKVEA